MKIEVLYFYFTIHNYLFFVSTVSVVNILINNPENIQVKISFKLANCACPSYQAKTYLIYKNLQFLWAIFSQSQPPVSHSWIF